MCTGYFNELEFNGHYTELISERFQKILDFPLYRENPMNITLDSFLHGCAERQSGIRYTRVSDYFYNAIFKFCTLVTVGPSGFDNTFEDNYTLIIDSDNGYSSITLYDSNLLSYEGDEIMPWMSTLNERPIRLLEDTWNAKDQIWFLSYWDKVKKTSHDYVNHFYFTNIINLGHLKKEMTKAQIYVLNKILEDPTLIEDDDFISWTCCSPPEEYERLLKQCVCIFNQHFRHKYLELLKSRQKINL